MTILEHVMLIAAVILGTMLTRFLPFLVFREGKESPAWVIYLSKFLPSSMIGLLVVYALKDIPESLYYGMPEGIAILVLLLVHKWRHNMLITLVCSTVTYMWLVQKVFI